MTSARHGNKNNNADNRLNNSRISQNNAKRTTPVPDPKKNVPVFEANLFSQHQQQHSQRSTSGLRNTSANSRGNPYNNGSQTERQTIHNRGAPLIPSREKPLLILEVNLGPNHGQPHMVSMGVYKDDNAHIVADRVIKESRIKFSTTAEQRLKIRQLGQLLEV